MGGEKGQRMIPVVTEHDVECKAGWKTLYMPILWYCQTKGIPVMQVKEKFGTLRVYVGPNDDPYIGTLINAMEAYSNRVCEDCGEHGIRDWVRQKDGSYTALYKATTNSSRTSQWVRTLCGPCREAWDRSREARGATQTALDTGGIGTV